MSRKAVLSPLRGIAVIAAAIAAFGCGSAAEHAQQRRAVLLELYPPGMTSRTVVQARIGRREPGISEMRPNGGWGAASPYVREYVLASEQRTGKAVHRCERYSGVDPTTFLGLEFNWFFYDDADVVLDVEWQFQSD